MKHYEIAAMALGCGEEDMTEKLERILKVGTLQEFLEMSDEDMAKAKVSGTRMADMINTLWRAVQQLVDQRNKEAAELDELKQEMGNQALELKELIEYADYLEDERFRD